MRALRRALALASCAAVATATGGWLATSPASATAGEVTRAEVEYRGGRFLVHTEVLIQAHENQVRAILTDYAHLDRVNNGIKRIHILPRVHPQKTRMQVVWEMCVLFICLDFNQVQDVEEQDNGDIVATVVPRYSDFRQATGRWRIAAAGDNTRLTFDADITPDFWFPPVIGPWLIKTKLRKEALETAAGVERVAGSPTPSGARANPSPPSCPRRVGAGSTGQEVCLLPRAQIHATVT